MVALPIIIYSSLAELCYRCSEVGLIDILLEPPFDSSRMWVERAQSSAAG
jgi:hypothetical protein